METKSYSLNKYLPEAVYGGIDGIVTTFAVVSGFLGAGANDSVVVGSSAAVLLFGLANLFADATSMGLGDFLSERTRIHKVLGESRQVQQRIKAQPVDQLETTRADLIKRGLTDADQTEFLRILRQHPQLWHDYIMQLELQEHQVADASPMRSALTTFSAFIIFGAIPLLPFILLSFDSTTGLLSVAGTIFALALLGGLRWYFVRGQLWRSILEIVFLGSLAAVVAFGVGFLFRG